MAIDGKGRPLELTPEFVEKAEELLAEGNYAVTVAGLLGISEDTWYRWLKLADDSAEERPIFSEFRQAAGRGSAIAEHNAVCLVRRHAREDLPGDWRPAMEFLRRRFPDRWGNRQKVEADVRATTPAESPRERLRARFDQMARARAEQNAAAS
ncbi:MAG: hypothetical protein RQ751_11665, partial [Longimicrobiales bacterium]|nr:hypothetical protein [Longimicrobiales bacterium]